MHTLVNAAREMIEGTLAMIHTHGVRGEREEDLASALREQQVIEADIAQLQTLLEACREIARMKHPSIEHLLRHRGFGFEADRIADVVLAIEAIDHQNNLSILAHSGRAASDGCDC